MWAAAILVLSPVLINAQTSEDAEIRSLHVISDIRFRFARTLVTSRVVNPTTRATNMTFHVNLPSTAYITSFKFYSARTKTTYAGSIAEKEAATHRFHQSQQAGKPVALIGQRETNSFRVTISVGAGDKITFNLTYEEVLQRRQGLYHHNIYIDPGQPVPDVKIDVAIQETRDITTLKTPLTPGNAVTDLTGAGELVEIQRPTSRSAFIRLHPTLDQQLARWAEGISGRFSVMYDVQRGFDAGDLLVSNGYFIHFFAPSVPDPVPKDVLFILDTSTSMFSGKLQQLKTAMAAILRDLNPRDRFNIITFGSRVVFWQKKMADVEGTTNVDEAIQYLDSVKALGWTNIKKALERGITYLGDNTRSAEGSLVIFLTDGKATSGETNPDAIQKIVRKANTKDIPVYTVAFGREADWELMKKVALQNFGIAKRIYTDGNAARQIQDFYGFVASTMLHGVTFKHANATSEKTQNSFSNYINGSELIFTGHNNQSNPHEGNVVAISSSGGIDLKPSKVMTDLKKEFQNLTSLYDDLNMDHFTQRMWAYLLVREHLKNMVGEREGAKKDLLREKALALAFKYGFVTSITSMIVDTPDRDKLGDYTEKDDLYYEGADVLTTPAPYYTRSYYGGGGGGWSSGGGGGDPHFMVHMEGLKYPICFDIPGEDKEMYQFVEDPDMGLTINMRIGQGQKRRNAGGFRMYMTEFAIMLKDLRFLVTRDNIHLQGVTYTWGKDYNGSLPGAQFFIMRENAYLTRLILTFDNRLRIDVTKHVHKDSDPLGGDYLNIEVGNSELLSDNTDGILGQFIHKKIRLNNITYKNGRLMGHLRTTTGQEIEHGRARIVHRRDPIWHTSVSCWMLRSMAKHIFDAPPEDFMVSNMYQTDLV